MNDAPPPPDAPYRDPSRPVAERVADLLARMTLDEKLAQLGSAWPWELADGLAFSPAKAAVVLRHGLGQLSRAGGGTFFLPAESVHATNAVQALLVEGTRLGIPALVHEECASGYMARGATVFPQTIGLAATFRPDLAEAVGDFVRRQLRAVGAHQALGPVLDLARDARWGRLEETFGACPRLAAALGAAFVRGLQGDGPGAGGVLATGKHFLGYGLPEGGMNWAPVRLGPRELRQAFAAPFEAALREANLASVMHGYHELDGVPCAADEALLTGLLREELGFDGLVVSDYFAIGQLVEYHRLARDKKHAAALALRAGIDVELPTTDCYGEPLRQALAEGLVEETLVDRAVGRVLAAKFALGLFEHPYADPEAVAEAFDPAPARALAREVAEASFVLLKNDGALLPLDPAPPCVAVIGPNADAARHLFGDYTYASHVEAFFDPSTFGSDVGKLPEGLVPPDVTADVPSVLDAVRARAGDTVEVVYARGCAVHGGGQEGFAEAVEAARHADVAVLVVGDRSGLGADCTSGESRDRAELGLPGHQEALVRAVAATGTPVVLVVVGGRAFALTGVVEHTRAILLAWLPGETGGEAIARTLFGDTAPGGKLPVSLPRAAGQMPLYYNHPPSGGRSHWRGPYVDLPTTPLFAFGHGLSYTTFEVSDAALSAESVPAGEGVSVRCTLRNTGARAGSEVVQVYARQEGASVTRPVRQLVAFARVALAPGEARELSLDVPARALAFYGQDMVFAVEPGAVHLAVGTASDWIAWEGVLEITGERTPLPVGRRA